MKVLKRLLVWTIFAVILQQGIFLYIEKVYMASDLNIEFVEDDGNADNQDEKTEIEMKKSAEDVAVSSNGRFVSYIEDDKLNILDSQEDKVNIAQSDGEIMCYKWVTNANRIIAVQKIKESGKNYFEPISFDGTNGDVIELADFDLNKLRIPLGSSDDTIEDIVFSIGTHSLYIKVKKSNGLCDLYKANTMNQLERQKAYSNKEIGNIVVPTTAAKALIEMGNNITKLDSSDNLRVSSFTNPKVLGADIDDNIYFGEERDGQIEKIAYTTATGDFSKWSELKLDKPVDRENIAIEYSGKVYVNDSEAGSVHELMSNKTINYKGDFVQIYSKGVISRENNKLIKNRLN